MRAIDVQRIVSGPKRQEIRDDATPGLVLRVTPAGAKSWALVYDLGKRRRKLTLGTWPAMGLADARAAVRLCRVAIHEGRDPVLERRVKRQELAEGFTVERLAGLYLTEYAMPVKRSWKDDRQILAKHLARYAELPARDFTRAHLLDILAAARAAGMGRGRNNVLATLRKMFGWAVEQGLLEISPAVGVKAPEKPQARDRFLTEAEIAEFWLGLDRSKLSADIRAALRIQLLTGLRLGEVLGASWREVDLGALEWRIGRERMKSGRAHLVPISPPVRELFVEQRRRAPADACFPGRAGGAPIGVGAVCRRLAANLSAFDMPAFKTHDLRRTCSTHMLRLGVQPVVVDSTLAHAPSGVLQRHYSVYTYEAERRIALDLWGQHVLDLVGKAARHE